MLRKTLDDYAQGEPGASGRAYAACDDASDSTPSASAVAGPRLLGVSARDFRAFCLYRNLGVGRSLQKAWRAYCIAQRQVGGKLRGRPRRGGDALTNCPGAWTALSSKYHWVQRAEAYDRQLDKQSDAASIGLCVLEAKRRVQTQ